MRNGRSTGSFQPHLSDTPKKPYERPAIVHEMRLEVQAGSPIRKLPDPLDLLGTGPGSS